MRAQEESLSTYQKPLFITRTFSYSRGHSSFRGHLRPENFHAPNSSKVHSFSKTFAPSKTATTTALLDSRLQLRSPTSPMIITSWAVMDWGGLLTGDHNNQVLTIAAVTTILHMKITAVMPISPSSASRPTIQYKQTSLNEKGNGT